MSAWDVAGAVAGAALAALGIISVFTGSHDGQTSNAIAASLGLVWSAFCLARIFGAHL